MFADRPESAMGWVRNIDAQSKLTLIHAEDFSMSLQKCKIPLVQLCAVAAMPFKVVAVHWGDWVGWNVFGFGESNSQQLCES